MSQNFMVVFARVLNRYSKLPATDIDRMGYHCKGLTDSEMSRLCDMIIDTSKYTPTVPDVIECVNKIKAGRPRLDVVKDTFFCKHCRGSGYVNKHAKRGGHWYEFTFGCPVETCRAFRDKAPPSTRRWHHSMSNEYFDDYDNNDGGGAA